MRDALRAWGRRGIWHRRRRKRRWRFWRGCTGRRELTQRTLRQSTLRLRSGQAEVTESWPVTVETVKVGAELPHSKGGNIDRFSRLAALKPARGIAPRPVELRAPDETDSLSRLLGAGIARNHFGEHLAIRNWVSTPEFVQPSPVALELLTKRPAAENVRRKKQTQDSRAALDD